MNIALQIGKKIIDLRPKGLTPEEVEKAKANAGEFWPGQVVMIKTGKKQAARRARVIAVDEETDELRIRFLDSEKPAIIYPAQADNSFDAMRTGITFRRRKH